MAQWDEDMGIGGRDWGRLGKPHSPWHCTIDPAMLFVHGFSRAGQHAGDGDAEDNTEGHLTHGTPGLDAARPPSSGTGAVSSGWTPSALGPGVAICYLPQQVATGITTPLCLCLASERASFQVAGIGIDKQHFRCQQSKHCATFHGGDGIPFGYLPVSGNEAVNCTFWHSTVAQAGSELVSEHNLQIPMTRSLAIHAVTGSVFKGNPPVHNLT